MTRRIFRCGSAEHSISRRAFLGGVGAAIGLDVLGSAALANQMQRQQKRVIMLFLSGGASQFETWDPKPGRPTGGPFQTIQTSIPGYRVCELMPRMAARMHKTRRHPLLQQPEYRARGPRGNGDPERRTQRRRQHAHPFARLPAGPRTFATRQPGTRSRGPLYHLCRVQPQCADGFRRVPGRTPRADQHPQPAGSAGRPAPCLHDRSATIGSGKLCAINWRAASRPAGSAMPRSPAIAWPISACAA